MTNNDKPRAVYEPGELDKVREKLGPIDKTEAKRMAQVLGGEVGTEKEVQPSKPISSGVRRKTVEMALPGQPRKRPGRMVETISAEEEFFGSKALAKMRSDPADDPAAVLKMSYGERLKMDRQAAQFEFEIKNSIQVLVAAFSFSGDPTDHVNPRFVSHRMNEYYGKIEQLVTSTRSLLPRNNARRSERLKKASPFVYTVLDTIRNWNIERIGTDMANIQSHPRSVRVTEFADILRSIYKPLFVLEKLDMEIHIKGAYKLLYKLIFIENPAEPKEKNQELIRIALASFASIRRDVHYGLYPLLMKLISDRWFPYEKLFIQRHRRFMAFIGAIEDEQIMPLITNPEQGENGSLEELRDDIKREEQGDEEEKEDPSDPEVIARKTREAVAAAERKAVGHSIGAMEALFPKAGWDKLAEYPDLYPYFSSIFELRHGYELIAPNDPLQQIAVLMHIMEHLCTGLRYASFGVVAGPDGNAVSVDAAIGEIITNWQLYIDDSFVKEYLPRLSEYCRMLEHSSDAKNSVYGKKTLNELRWIKRQSFLPYFKFEAMGPPPIKSQEIVPIYNQTRTLRKILTQVAAGIEMGNRKGGAEKRAPCNGIDNPWEQYHFELPNPVSRRLDALLAPGKRNNAVLVFFALSTVTILDNLLNSETSWAYNNDSVCLFRSLHGDGTVPVFGVDEKIDADQLFRNTLKKRQEKQQRK